MNDYEEKEWFARFPNMTILPLILWALVIGLTAGALLYGISARAEPIAQASSGNIVITVFNEPCTHPDAVSNLPNRATWKEGDKVYDGCVGVNPELGMAMFWWTDKTVVVVPLQVFVKIVNA